MEENDTKNFKHEFTKCPNCGSEERFFEMLGKEAVQNGTVNPQFSYSLDAKQGVVTEPNQHVVAGQKLIGWAFKTDICCKCGTVYALLLLEGEAKVAPTSPKLIIPQTVLPKGNRRSPN